MKSKRQQKLYDHYKTVFGEEPIFSLKLKKNVLPTDMKPITTLVFKPTDEMPFWKLCTIGASDYLMPERNIGFGRKANRRNEYYSLKDTVGYYCINFVPTGICPVLGEEAGYFNINSLEYRQTKNEVWCQKQ